MPIQNQNQGFTYQVPNGGNYITQGNMAGYGSQFSPRIVPIPQGHPYYNMPRYADAIASGGTLYGTLQPFSPGQYQNVQAILPGSSTTSGGSNIPNLSLQNNYVPGQVKPQFPGLAQPQFSGMSQSGGMLSPVRQPLIPKLGSSELYTPYNRGALRGLN